MSIKPLWFFPWNQFHEKFREIDFTEKFEKNHEKGSWAKHYKGKYSETRILGTTRFVTIYYVKWSETRRFHIGFNKSFKSCFPISCSIYVVLLFFGRYSTTLYYLYIFCKMFRMIYLELNLVFFSYFWKMAGQTV